MNRKQYKEYRLADKTANHMNNPMKQWLLWNDNYRVFYLLRLLRRVEYYSLSRNIWGRMIYYLNLWLFRRQRVRTNIMLFPGTIGPGVQLMHPGFRRIDSFVKIGKNATILPMVLLGRKHPTDVESDIIIGDNCYISTGVTILGPVRIGDNVTIGAGAVVTKDIPDNTVVGGVPAKIICSKVPQNTAQ